MRTPTEKENGSIDSQSTEPSETEASTFDNPQDSAAANDSQDPASAPCGQVRIVRDWQAYDMPATAAAVADWCRANAAPDVKPAGEDNAPNLGFLISHSADAVPIGHPKIDVQKYGRTDVAFTHGCSFDLDKISGEQILETLDRTKSAGYAAVFWESHSSTEAEPKGRLLVLLDPPCTAERHAAVYRQLQAELCPWTAKGQDNANRGWNPPRAGAELIEFDGRPVDWHEVVARAPKAPEASPAPKAAPNGPALIGPSNMEFAIRLCQTHPAFDAPGESGQKLVALGCKLILGCGLDLETAVVTALRYYDPRCTDGEGGETFPWGEAEIRRAFAKAATKEPSKDQAQWRGVLDEVAAAENGAPESGTLPKLGTPEHDALMARNQADQAAEIEAAAQAKRWKVTKAGDLCKPLPPVDWLCKALDLAPGRTSVLSGTASSGKTMGAMDLALSVASGKPVFGDARFAVRQGNVLHVDVDQGAYATTRRYQQLAKGRGLDLEQLPLECIFWQVCLTAAGERKGGIDPDAVRQLRDHCADKALCIIDSLRGVAPDMDENSSEFGAVLQVLTEVADQTRCTFLLVHHDGKAGTPRGTSAIKDRAGSFWQAAREDGRVTWSVLKPSEFSLGSAQEFTTELDHLGNNPSAEFSPFRIKIVSGDAAVAAPEGSAIRSQRDRDKAAILAHLDWKDFAKLTDMASYFDGEEGRPKIGKHRIEDALRELVTDRKIERVKSGKSTIYKLGSGGTVVMARGVEGAWQSN